MKVFCTFFILPVFLACQADNRNNPRAYVEGKINGSQLDYQRINVILKSDNTNIAETVPNNSGDFSLSGPLISDSFSLVLNKKIRSFSTSKTGCTISADSLQILIPAGTNHIIFNEIKVK